MRVVLINPPQTNSKYKFLGVIAPPLGLAYMAAVLEKEGIDVTIIDASALNMTREDLERELEKISPQVVAITALTPTIEQALDSAQLARKVAPQALIVMGGYHPTFNYDEVLSYDYVDVVIRGEGEYTLLELVKTLKRGGDLSQVRGLALDNHLTPPRPLISDLDELPFPARHLLPVENYSLLNIKKMSTMITSRGCPMQCSFCASAALHGSKIRLRSPQNIVDEMEYLVQDMDMETIAFMDDTFTLHPPRVKEICNEIKKRKLEVFWGCTARVDNLNPEIIKKMREAGCIALFLGVESADQQILDGIKKNTTINRIKSAFEMCKREKMRTIASVMLGMPGDTYESIKRTINFVQELKPSYAIYSLATPYPGTQFYQQAWEKNLIKVKDWSKYNLLSPILDTVDCSREDLKRIQNRAFVKFYLRPSYIISQIRMDGFIILRTILAVLRKTI